MKTQVDQVRCVFGVLFLALSAAGCGSDEGGTDSGTADAARDAAADDGGADAIVADGGAGEADASVAACPTVLDGTLVAETPGTERADWILTFEPLDGALGLSAAGGGGAVVMATMFTNGDDRLLGSQTVYDGGESTKLIALGHATDAGSFDWAYAFVPVTPSQDWQPTLRMVPAAEGVYIAISLDRAVTLGGVTYNEAGAQTLLVGHLTSTGLAQAKTYGTGELDVRGLVADSSGQLIVAVRGTEPVDFGDGDKACKVHFLGLSNTSERLFDRCMTSSGNGFSNLDGFALDDQGRAYASGFPLGDYNVGTGERTIDSSRGASVLFEMSGSDGTTNWSSESIQSYVRQLELGSSDSIVTTGHVPTRDENTKIAGSVFRGCTFSDDFPYHLSFLSRSGALKQSFFVARDGAFVADSTDLVLMLVRPGETPFAQGMATNSTGVWLVGIGPSGLVEFAQDLSASEGSFGASSIVQDENEHIYVLGDLQGTLTLGEHEATATPGIALVRF